MWGVWSVAAVWMMRVRRKGIWWVLVATEGSKVLVEFEILR